MSYLGLGSEEGVADVAHPPGGVSVVTGAVDVDVGVVLKWDTESCPWSVRDTGNEPQEPALWKTGNSQGVQNGPWLWGNNQATNSQPMGNQ